MTIEERSELLKNLAAQLIAAHWAFRHSAKAEIDEGHQFWAAADALCDACGSGAIPADCRGLFDAVYGDGSSNGFKFAWKRWSHEQLNKGNPDWLVPQSVWSAYGKVKNSLLRQVAPPRLIETVAELHEQGVTPQQIADIYEWRTRLGHPDLARVHDAIRNPGKHDTDEARDLNRQKQTAQTNVWDAYARKLARSGEVRRIREQLEGGVDPESDEAVTMTQVTPRGPRLAFDDAEEDAYPASEETDAETGEYDSVEIQSPEEQILELVDQGLDDAAIVDRLGVTRQKVAAVKKRRGEIEQPA